GGVGGATGVLVCFCTGRNFFGDADFGRGDLRYGQVRCQFVWRLGIFARVVTNDQGHRYQLSLLRREAPLGIWPNTRKAATYNIPQIKRMLRSFWCNDRDVLPE